MKNNLVTAIEQAGHIIDSWLPYKIKHDKTPGLSVGIVYKDKLVYVKGFGVRDIESGGQLNEHSLFHIASISKTFTAVAILQLQERGLLKVGDKVSKYLPWFVGKSEKGKIDDTTIHQLLTHSSGLFRDGTTPHWVTGNFPLDIKSDFSVQAKINKNNTGFKYSNYGFAVLGLLIESVTGVTYREYVQENILDVLGMKNTFVDCDGQEAVVGYGREIPGEKRETFSNVRANAYAPATGFISSVSDMSKFISALTFTHKGGQVLNLNSKKLLSKVQEKTEDGDKYGYGVDVMKVLKHKIVGHSGGYAGFNTQFIIDLELGLGLIVLANTTRGGAHSLARGIVDMIYRLLDNPDEFKSKIKIRPEKYEGLYRNLWGDDVVVGVKDVLVSISSETQTPLKYKTLLVPQKESDTFLMKTYGVFGSNNELAKFKDFRDGKAQVVVFGATPSKRVVWK